MTVPRITQNGLMNSAQFAFNGSIAVPLYAFMYHDADDVKPAASQADGGTEAINQLTFAQKFAGVALSCKTTSETAADPNFPVATDVEGIWACASSTFEVGDLLAVDEAAGGTALENLKLVKTTDPASAIGYATERQAAAVTSIAARLISKVVQHQATPSGFPFGAAATATMTGNVTLVGGSARVQKLDPGGSARDVTLPAAAKGLWFVIKNTADAAEVITVKNAAASALCTPTQNETAIVWCSDGTNWDHIVASHN